MKNIVRYEEDTYSPLEEEDKHTQYEEKPKGKFMVASQKKSIPGTATHDQWVRMSNGQFFQIQIPENELKDDSIMMEAMPFDPSETILGNQNDNPYATFDLEDVQLQSEEEDREH